MPDTTPPIHPPIRDDAIHRRKPWYRLRNVVLVVLTILIGVVAYAFYWQASLKPNPVHDYKADLIAISEAAQPEGENGWPHLLDACNVIYDLKWGSSRDQINLDLEFDYELLLTGEVAQSAEIDSEHEDVASAEDVLQVVRELEQRGVFRFLDKSMSCPRFVNTEFVHYDDLPGHEDLLMSVLLSELSSLRTIREIIVARMSLHARAGKTDLMLADLKLVLFIDEALFRQPFMMHYMTASLGVTFTLEIVREIIVHTHPSLETLNRMDAMIQNLPNDHHLESAIESGRMINLDLIQHLFTEDGQGDGILILDRYNQITKPMASINNPSQSFVIDWLPGNFGGLFMASRQETTKVNDGYFDEWIRLAKLPRENRVESMNMPISSAGNLGPRFSHMLFMLSSIQRLLDTADTFHSQLHGTRIIIALESYRLDHEALPDSLEELVPEYLDALPSDPFSPYGFRYVRSAKTIDSEQNYSLYSVGPDGKAETQDDLPFTSMN